MRRWIDIVLAPLVAWAVLTAVVLTAYADWTAPVGYLTRPLVAALAGGLVIGVVSQLAGRHAVGAAAALSVGLTLPVTLVPIAVLVIGAVLLHRRGRAIGVTTPVLVAVAALVVLSLIRAVPLMIEDGFPRPADLSAPEPTAGPPIYLILLDGYPRIDTLAALGIDNQPFVNAIEQLGFDHYPTASSNYGWTHLTVSSLLVGESREADRAGSVDVKRRLRQTWHLPAEWAVIPPPLGFVTIPDAREIGPGGLNDFEVNLLSESLFRFLPNAGTMITNDLRARLAQAIDTIASTPERRLFAHLFFPHPPFLYDVKGEPRGLPPCGLECGVFNGTMESLELTRIEWASGMDGNLRYLNGRVLDAIGTIVSREPDAVIVLFSDHGGRRTPSEPEEWHRSFLAARTPGHPDLFIGDPGPDEVLRTVLAAYDDDGR